MAATATIPAKLPTLPAERFFRASLFFLILTSIATLVSTGRLAGPASLAGRHVGRALQRRLFMARPAGGVIARQGHLGGGRISRVFSARHFLFLARVGREFN